MALQDKEIGADGIVAQQSGVGVGIVMKAESPPSGVRGFAPMCIWLKTASLVAGGQIYINTGTSESCTFLTLAEFTVS
jgi:hypothetical protein